MPVSAKPNDKNWSIFLENNLYIYCHFISLCCWILVQSPFCTHKLTFYFFVLSIFPKCKRKNTNIQWNILPLSTMVSVMFMMACIHLKHITSMRSILHAGVADDYILCRLLVMFLFNPTDRFKISKTQENRPKNVIVSKSMNAHSKLWTISTSRSPVSFISTLSISFILFSSFFNAILASSVA